MGDAALYAEAAIIGNEVKIYSFPCSVKITFSSIKTSSITAARGPGPSPARELKSIHCAEELQSAAPLS